VNSDDWRPAGSFPEFRRYLDLASATVAAPVAAQPAAPRNVAELGWD